ncbi:MAG: type II secretion system F family protein, partial [Phycisphaeraceae bacterium]
LVGAAIAAMGIQMLLTHLEHKRRMHLERQIVDGITTMASGIRAGLNLVQSMDLLVQHAGGPIRQEFAQLLKEYELGIDLNRAMRHASERIGSTYYRLLFTAIEAHRQRGGDLGQSLDQIADSIREFQRLEGRLTALTAQGRSQARFMAVLPLGILFILGGIFPQETGQLLTEPVGRVILLIAGLLIAGGMVWIRRIMQVQM